MGLNATTLVHEDIFGVTECDFQHFMRKSFTPQNLAFLYPLKRVQTELAGRLKQEPSAVAVYKWIKVKNTLV